MSIKSWWKGRLKAAVVEVHEPPKDGEARCPFCAGPLFRFNFGRQAEGPCGISVESQSIHDGNRSFGRFADVEYESPTKEEWAWLVTKGRSTGRCGKECTPDTATEVPDGKS